MNILIGLTGPTGVGKDTIALILSGTHDATRLAFGDPLKRAALEVFGMSEEWLRDDHKTRVHPYWGITPREMFQKLGTDAVRSVFGADHWVRRLEKDYERANLYGNSNVVVVTDVRYNGENTEANWVRSQGGTVVHVQGPQRRDDVGHAHVSNMPVEWHPGDFVIQNAGDMDALRAEVAKLMLALEGSTTNA